MLQIACGVHGAQLSGLLAYRHLVRHDLGLRWRAFKRVVSTRCSNWPIFQVCPDQRDNAMVAVHRFKNCVEAREGNSSGGFVGFLNEPRKQNDLAEDDQ